MFPIFPATSILNPVEDSVLWRGIYICPSISAPYGKLMPEITTQDRVMDTCAHLCMMSPSLVACTSACSQQPFGVFPPPCRLTAGSTSPCHLSVRLSDSVMLLVYGPIRGFFFPPTSLQNIYSYMFIYLFHNVVEAAIFWQMCHTGFWPLRNSGW